MNRFTRKLASLLGIVAVIFAQLAVSAHACPMQFVAMDEFPVAAASAADSSGAGDESPALCQKHCEHASQNINDTPQPLAFVALTPSFVVTLLPEPAAPRLASARVLQDATSPPHAIRNCCFRI